MSEGRSVAFPVIELTRSALGLGRLRALATLAFIVPIALPRFASAQASPPPARAGAASGTYVVQPGDTCPSIALRLYGDARRIDLVHRDNPQLGRPPHHLRPGQILRVPPREAAARPPASTGPDARLTFVRRDVQAFTPEQHDGHVDDPLNRGHRVNTLANASAEVTYADETQLQLGEQTLVVIFGDLHGAARNGSAADTTLVNGSLRARLGALAGRRSIPIATETARAEVGPGEAQVTVDTAHTTRLAVYHGQSRVSARRRTVRVPEGYGSRVRRGESPSPPQLLPLAPDWTTPPAALVLSPSATITVTGDYAAGHTPPSAPAPAQWHVQIARDARFNDLVVDTRVPAAVTHLEAQGVTPGELFVRVSAIDTDPFEGLSSVVSTVRFVQMTATDRPDGARSVDVGTGLFCAVDDAPLEAVRGPVVIADANAHRLRCALDAGGTGAVVTPIAARTVASSSPPPAASEAPIASSSPSPAPPITAPTSTRRLHFLVGLHGGFGFTPWSVSLGLAGGLEAGAEYAVGPGAIRAGVRATYERHSTIVTGLSLLEQDVSVALAVGYRFAPPSARFAPYVLLTPAYVAQRLESGASGAQNVETAHSWSVGALGGIEAIVGPAALFAEIAARYAPLHSMQTSDPTLSIVQAFFGARLRF